MSVIDKMTEGQVLEMQRCLIEKNAQIHRMDKERLQLEKTVRRHELQLAHFVDAWEHLGTLCNAVSAEAARLTPGISFTTTDPIDTRSLRGLIAAARLLPPSVKPVSSEVAMGLDGLVPVRPLEVTE